MGCTACFRDRTITEPYRRGSMQSLAILEEELKRLTPCQLVKSQEFQRLWQLVVYECETSQSRAPRRSQEESILMAVPEPPLYLDFLSSKWKLLIFCRGFDFYEKQEDQLNLTLTHNCFPQINKDLNRTFPEEPLFQSSKGVQQLKRCLQRTALYFPAIGYTQGVNFIIGYLMLRKFNESDTFWLTIHFALCERYLLMGLFEDGFPLAGIYCRLFKLLLRQHLPQLHKRLLDIGVSDEIWIFKWFMTYFLYSFPMEVVESVWDVTIMLGGLGLVYFAYSIVEQLYDQLMECCDDSDVSTFLAGLRNPKTFKMFVNLMQVVSRSYEVKLSEKQIASGIKTLRNGVPQKNFYLDYFASYDNHDEQVRLLHEWHRKLRQQRVSFKNEQLSNKFQRTQSDLQRPKKRQTKFRVKDQQRREEQLRVEIMKRSASVFSQMSGNSSYVAEDLPSSRRYNEISNISRVLSQANSQQIPSEESVIDTINPQESNRSDRRRDHSIVEESRMNASVHITIPETNIKVDHHEQHEIEIFDLKGKPFKKKKVSENNTTKLHNRIFKKISQKQLKLPRKTPSLNRNQNGREILQSIENQDISVVQFDGSSNFIESISDKKAQARLSESLANNESINIISLEDKTYNKSIEFESVR